MKNIFSTVMTSTALLSAGLCFGQNTDISQVYGSYYGGSSEEFYQGRTLARDSEGRAAFVGSTASNFMQTSSDAYQSGLMGGANIVNSFIVRMDESGIPFYASYFGGGGESTVSLAFTDDDRILLGGYTSQPNLPVTDGAHQTEFLINPDFSQVSRMGFVAMFSESNELEWCTYLGGSGLDNVSDVVSGPDNFVYAVGSTRSQGLGTEGSFQEGLPEEVINAGFVARFTPEGERDYFTYLGDAGLGAISSCALSPDGTKLYVAGGTNAPQNFISSGIQDEFGGVQDVYLACFDAASGNLLWSRYIGGSGNDVSGDMAVSESGEVVMMISTRSEGLATPGAHLEIAPPSASADDRNRLIVSLNEDGQTNWATYFDRSSSWFPNLALSVLGNKILISGQTSSEEGVTKGAPFESTLPESGGQVFAKFDLQSGAQIWGTYFGNEGFTDIADIMHLDDDRFVVFGRAGSPNGYITADAFQSAYFGNMDFFFAIFEENTLSTTGYEKAPLSVYPNPAVSEVRISVPGSLFGATDLRVFDLSGREVVRNRAFRSGEVLSIAGLPDGIYLLHLTDGDKTYRAKLVVAR